MSADDDIVDLLQKMQMSTVQEYADFLYINKLPFRFNGPRDYFSLLCEKPQTLLLNDIQQTVGQLIKFYDSHLPSDSAIEKKRGCKRGKPCTIEYTFTSSTCVFGAYCTICDDLITKAYVGVTVDPAKATDADEHDERGNCHVIAAQTYDGGLSFQEALERRYKTLGFWTSEEWLLCSVCAEKNNSIIDENGTRQFEIVRHFAFYGDLPRGRAKFRWCYGNFDRTRDDLFREPFFKVHGLSLVNAQRD